MRYKQQIVQLLEMANLCDSKGLHHTAQKLDDVIAQLSEEDDDIGATLEGLETSEDAAEDASADEGEVGEDTGDEEIATKDERGMDAVLPEAAETPEEPKGEMYRSLGLQLAAYVTFINDVIDSFGYLGEDKIQSIKTALFETNDLMERTLQEETNAHYTEMVKKFREALSKSKAKLQESAQAPMDRVKVILDRYLLFGPFDRLNKAIQRQFKDERFGELLYKINALSTVIRQVIEAVPENVSKTDLVQAR